MKDKLNMGCGTIILPDCINLDFYKFKGVDIVHNLNKFPYPFKDNSFKEIIAEHILEHLDDTVKVMEELHRISKPGAIIKIKLPYFSGLDYIKDPTHKRPFAAATFDFFERGKLGKGNYFDESSKINFKIIKIKIIYSSNSFLKIFNPLVNLNHKVYERFFAYIFPSQVLEVELRALK